MIRRRRLAPRRGRIDERADPKPPRVVLCGALCVGERQVFRDERDAVALPVEHAPGEAGLLEQERSAIAERQEEYARARGNPVQWSPAEKIDGLRDQPPALLEPQLLLVLLVQRREDPALAECAHAVDAEDRGGRQEIVAVRRADQVEDDTIILPGMRAGPAADHLRVEQA